MNILLTARTKRWRCPVAAALITAIALTAVPLKPVHAALVGTDQIVAEIDGTPRARVNAFLSRADVRAALEARGIAPQEAEQRVAALSDAEVANIAGRIDSLPAGQGAGPIIGAIVLVFLVLLLTDLLGLTSVYGFTKKGSLSPN